MVSGKDTLAHGRPTSASVGLGFSVFELVIHHQLLPEIARYPTTQEFLAWWRKYPFMTPSISPTRMCRQEVAGMRASGKIRMTTRRVGVKELLTTRDSDVLPPLAGPWVTRLVLEPASLEPLSTDEAPFEELAWLRRVFDISDLGVFAIDEAQLNAAVARAAP